MIRKEEILCEELLPFFKEAENGRKIWLEIKERERIRSTDVLIFLPTEERTLCQKAVDLLDQFISRKHYSRAILFVDDEMINTNISALPMKQLFSVRFLPPREFRALLRYYRAVSFFPNMIVVSCKKPYGSSGLIESGRVSEEEFVENTFYV